MLVEHNVLCPTCSNRRAICNMNSGSYGPCYECQAQGWALIKINIKESWLAQFFEIWNSFGKKLGTARRNVESFYTRGGREVVNDGPLDLAA